MSEEQPTDTEKLEKALAFVQTEFPQKDADHGKLCERLARGLQKHQLEHIPECAAIIEIGTKDVLTPCRLYGLTTTLLWRALETVRLREEQAERERLRGAT